MRGHPKKPGERARRKRREDLASLEPPKPTGKPLPQRKIDKVTDAEIYDAICEQQTLSTQAFALRVPRADYVARLATEPTRNFLRAVRAAADEVRATKLAEAMPFCASELVALAQKSSPQDSVRMAALQAVLTHGVGVRKVDVQVAPQAGAPRWPRPEPFRPRLVRNAEELANPPAPAPAKDAS